MGGAGGDPQQQDGGGEQQALVEVDPEQQVRVEGGPACNQCRGTSVPVTCFGAMRGGAHPRCASKRAGLRFVSWQGGSPPLPGSVVHLMHALTAATHAVPSSCPLPEPSPLQLVPAAAPDGRVQGGGGGCEGEEPAGGGPGGQVAAHLDEGRVFICTC